MIIGFNRYEDFITWLRGHGQSYVCASHEGGKYYVTAVCKNIQAMTLVPDPQFSEFVTAVNEKLGHFINDGFVHLGTSEGMIALDRFKLQRFRE